LITNGIGYVDRFKQFACAGQKIVTDILTRKKDVENNLGMSEYDMNGIRRCKIQFRSSVVSIELNCYTLFAR
jgi:hypothetical protein